MPLSRCRSSLHTTQRYPTRSCSHTAQLFYFRRSRRAPTTADASRRRVGRPRGCCAHAFLTEACEKQPHQGFTHATLEPPSKRCGTTPQTTFIEDIHQPARTKTMDHPSTDHLIIGISPFNPRFSFDWLTSALRWGATHFSTVDILHPGIAAASLLTATGTPIGRALRKARQQCNKDLRNVMAASNKTGVNLGKRSQFSSQTTWEINNIYRSVSAQY
ncbi:hypothetical protein CXB45_06570 [Corynebacterium mastitidis]|uniref:Cyclodipeptide synthase n=1 Tax=Corynebacterium mastitidis TaxID=161890 RepID=A0A2N0X792_9CORY|nr:hypothetical protein CXB45_06570 [Corynebacterium mastitidis]